jgi:hypothetical protein
MYQKDETIVCYCNFDFYTKRLNFNLDLTLNMVDRLMQAITASGQEFSTEAATIAALELWKIRNDKVYRRHYPTHARWLCNFKRTLKYGT